MDLDILKLGLDKNPLPIDINEQEIEHRQQREIEAIVKSVSEQSEFILLNARVQADRFKEQSQAMLQAAKNLPKEEKQKDLAQLRLTVRMTRFHTVEMSWNKIKFINNKRKSNGPNIITEYIKRPPKSYSYSANIFSTEPNWVKDCGPQIEQKLAILRQQAALVSGIRESLFRLSRLTHTYHNLLRQETLSCPDDDLALLDELMGANSKEDCDAPDATAASKSWITNSEKCQKWMKERQEKASDSTSIST